MTDGGDMVSSENWGQIGWDLKYATVASLRGYGFGIDRIDG